MHVNTRTLLNTIYYEATTSIVLLTSSRRQGNTLAVMTHEMKRGTVYMHGPHHAVAASVHSAASEVLSAYISLTTLMATSLHALASSVTRRVCYQLSAMDSVALVAIASCCEHHGVEVRWGPKEDRIPPSTRYPIWLPVGLR